MSRNKPIQKNSLNAITHSRGPGSFQSKLKYAQQQTETDQRPVAGPGLPSGPGTPYARRLEMGYPPDCSYLISWTVLGGPAFCGEGFLLPHG